MKLEEKVNPPAKRLISIGPVTSLVKGLRKRLTSVEERSAHIGK